MRNTRKMIYIFIILCLISCQDRNKYEEDFMIPDITTQIEKIQSAKIFFGHQSVGENIINGIKQLNNDNNMNLIEKEEYQELPDSFFLHLKIGQNENPESKCNAFASVIDSLNGNIDIVLMKFCYIDINRDTDVESLFEYYKTNMDSLIKKYPEVTFLHITSPLRYNAKGFGVWVRELLGRPNNSKLDNVKRNEYNNLLKTYYPEESIFDLAKYQSTYKDGEREYFEMNGNKNFSLIEEYTNDGGHLNELGSKIIAAELINILSQSLHKNKF